MKIEPKNILAKIINEIAIFIFRKILEKGFEAFKPKSFKVDINRILELEEKYKELLENAGILLSKRRRRHFWAQLTHESGLRPVIENMNYSASGLLRVFPKYFNPVTAYRFARKPEAIANRVYANRMGNGNEASGDGWRYRGRGFIQTTGKENYRELVKYGFDCVSNPDLLLQEKNAMIAAIHFWTKNRLNVIADRDDIEALTRRINGGTNGLLDRKNKYNQLTFLL